MRQRDYFDDSNLGNFRSSFPAKNPDLQLKYEAYMDEARNIFNEFTSSTKNHLSPEHYQHGYRGGLAQEIRGQYGQGTNPNTNTNVTNTYAVKLSSVTHEKLKAGDLGES